MVNFLSKFGSQTLWPLMRGITNPQTISGEHKLLGLDHLRAFAIGYVLLFHYKLFGHPDWVDKVGQFGWTGVDLFFVLSGFLIAGQLFAAIAKNGTMPVKAFFIKRFFRIIPPYLAILCLYFSFSALREREHMATLWRYLTFTTNFGLDISNIGTFTHSWSLCVEEQFYLILPLCILLVNNLRIGRRAVYLIAILFISGFAIRYLNWHIWVEPNLNSDNFGAIFYKFIYYPTYNRLDALLVGVSIAGMYTFYPDIKRRVNKNSNLIMLAGIVLLIATYFICTPLQTFNATIWGLPLIAIGYGLIVATAVCPANILYSPKSWLTSQIATLSYGIYLIHKLIFHLTQNLLTKAGVGVHSNLMMLCCIFSCIAGALLLRYAIEKPSLKLRDKVLTKKPTDRGGAAIPDTNIPKHLIEYL